MSAGIKIGGGKNFWRWDLVMAQRSSGTLREHLNRYQWVVGVMLLGIMALVVRVSLWPAFFPGRESLPDAYFVDEETGQETRVPGNSIPPLPGASGKLTRVRAVYYNSKDGKLHQLAYLEKFNPDTKALLDGMVNGKSPEINAAFFPGGGHLVRSPEPGAPWVDSNSADGRKLTESFPTLPDKRLSFCVP